MLLVSWNIVCNTVFRADLVADFLFVERRFLVFDKFCFCVAKLVNCPPPGNVVRFDVGSNGAAVAFEEKSTGG